MFEEIYSRLAAHELQNLLLPHSTTMRRTLLLTNLYLNEILKGLIEPGVGKSALAVEVELKYVKI